jgi:hypothetical protein
MIDFSANSEAPEEGGLDGAGAAAMADSVVEDDCAGEALPGLPASARLLSVPVASVVATGATAGAKAPKVAAGCEDGPCGSAVAT